MSCDGIVRVLPSGHLHLFQPSCDWSNSVGVPSLEPVEEFDVTYDHSVNSLTTCAGAVRADASGCGPTGLLCYGFVAGLADYYDFY